MLIRTNWVLDTAFIYHVEYMYEQLQCSMKHILLVLGSIVVSIPAPGDRGLIPRRGGYIFNQKELQFTLKNTFFTTSCPNQILMLNWSSLQY